MIKYLLLLLILPAYIYGDSLSLGRIAQSSGNISKHNPLCIPEECSPDRNLIFAGDIITAANGSSVRVILNEGTAIEIKGPAEIKFYNIRKSYRDRPTAIYAPYGAFSVIQNNRYIDLSLIFETDTAEIKTVDASLYIVSSKNETAIMTYRNRAGIASSLSPIENALILKEGKEVSVKKGEAPGEPVKVEILERGSWISRNYISKDRERIIRSRRDSSIIDWLFRNRN